MIVGFISIIALYISINAYILTRLNKWINNKIFLKIFNICFVILALLIIVQFILLMVNTFSKYSFINYLVKVVSNISYVWLGTFIYFLQFTLIAEIILLIKNLFFKNKFENFSSIIGMTVIAFSIIITIYGLINCTIIKDKTYDVKIKKLNANKKVVLISDLHIGAMNSINNLEKVVNKVNDKNADIVLIAGDIWDGNAEIGPDQKVAKELLSKIKAKEGVYACLGNHDAGNTYDKMVEVVKETGIVLLEDDYIKVNDTLTIVGRKDISPIGGISVDKRENTKEFMEKVPNDLPIIVMDHNPQGYQEYDLKTSLLLSGHTHKGQIFPGELFTNALFINDYGYYNDRKELPQSITTSGAGIWGMAMRVLTNSEVVTINLIGE